MKNPINRNDRIMHLEILIEKAKEAIKVFLENIDEGFIICEPNDELDESDFNEILNDLEKVIEE